MKKSLLIALFAAMPLMAQECPQKPCCAPQKPCCVKMQRPQLTEEQKAEMKAKFMEKFDADKDGQISDAEKEAIKAEFAKRGPKRQRPELTEEQKAKFEARKAEMKAKFMEKFDADKDGQLSDAEKEAAKAEFQKRGKKGHRRPCCAPKCEKN